MAERFEKPDGLSRRSAFWAGLAGVGVIGIGTGAATVPGTEAGFRRDGLGGVARSINDKLAEMPSLDDFGPIGDGKSDDWEKVQAALDWAGGRPGTRLRIPPRVFALSRPLLVPQSIELIGEISGDGNIPLSGFRALKGFSTNLSMRQAAKDAVEDMIIAALLISKGWAEGAKFSRQISLQNLFVDIDEVTEQRGGPIHGLMLANQQIDLSNIWIRSATGFGVWINTQKPDGTFTGPLVDNVLRRVWVRGAGVGGATFRNGSDVFHYGGFHIGALPGARDPTDAAEPPLATDGIMDYCTVAVGPEKGIGCRGNGIHITKSAGWRLTGCHLNGIGRHGIVLEKAFQTEISGCYIDGWGVDAEPNEGVFGSIWCNSIVGLGSGNDGGLIVSSNRISCRAVRSAEKNKFVAISLRAGAVPGAQVVVLGNVVIKRSGSSHKFALFDFGRSVGGALDAMVIGNIISADAEAFLNPWDEIDVRPRFTGNSFQFAEQPPGDGWYPKALRIENTSPEPGGASGWICVNSGDQAKWLGYGRIED